MKTRRRPSATLLLLAALVPAACGPSEEEANVLGRYLLESLAFARQSADTALLEQIFHPDATYDDFPGQIQYRGIEDIVGYVTSVHDWGDDVYLNVSTIHTGLSTATAEWFLSAVQARPMPDLVGVGTGRDVSWNGVTLIEIEAGRIARAADYWDRTGALLQLGLRIELPGGAVLEDAGAPN